MPAGELQEPRNALLMPAFAEEPHHRPASLVGILEVVEPRELTRYRTNLRQERSAEVNRLHKHLEGANIKLGAVAPNIVGLSVRQMLHALAAGRTNSAALAQLAQGRLRALGYEVTLQPTKAKTWKAYPVTPAPCAWRWECTFSEALMVEIAGKLPYPATMLAFSMASRA